jgi:glycosyltransferase involved in cell wall biosynthesis
MRVAHFNTHTTGGAAIAVRRLHEALLKRDVDSRFYFKYGPEPDETFSRIFYQPQSRDLKSYRKRLYNRRYLSPHLHGRPEGYEDFNVAWRVDPTPLDNIGQNVVNLHWIGDFIDYPSFFDSLPDNQPIVWTLHDMNPFTGGCHYSWECTKYRDGCSNCPQLAAPSPTDASKRNSDVKLEALRRKNLHIVGNSYWTEQEARRSRVFSEARSFRTIHYGLDTRVFTPRDKAACREALRLNPDSFVILFGADGIANRRKGLTELLEALKIIGPQRDLVLILFGHGIVPVEELGPVTIRHVGFQFDSDMMGALYSAADIFIMPSLYEAFGQTCLEALACGTPVVGFDTGGIPDMVIPKETGLLAPLGDMRELAQCIMWMMEHDEERRTMGLCARSFVEREYPLDLQARRYMELYQDICQTQ